MATIEMDVFQSSLSIRERKAQEATQMRGKSDRAQEVKLAEEIFLLRNVIFHPPPEWDTATCLEYAEGARQVAVICSYKNPALFCKFEILFRIACRKYFRRYGSAT